MPITPFSLQGTLGSSYGMLCTNTVASGSMRITSNSFFNIDGVNPADLNLQMTTAGSALAGQMCPLNLTVNPTQGYSDPGVLVLAPNFGIQGKGSSAGRLGYKLMGEIVT